MNLLLPHPVYIPWAISYTHSQICMSSMFHITPLLFPLQCSQSLLINITIIQILALVRHLELIFWLTFFKLVPSMNYQWYYGLNIYHICVLLLIVITVKAVIITISHLHCHNSLLTDSTRTNFSALVFPIVSLTYQRTSKMICLYKTIMRNYLTTF